MKNKTKMGIVLIPMQLILMYIFSIGILQYTINPVILQIGDFVPSLLIFLITIFLFKDKLVGDWIHLSISKWKLLVIGIFGVVAVQVIYNGVNLFFQISDDSSSGIAIPFSGLSLVDKSLFILFSLGSVLSGLTEEVYFRYLFIGRIFTKHKYLGLIISSFLFGLAHYFLEYTFVSTIAYMIIGLFFGLIYLKTNNIWYSIAIHVANNFCFSILIAFL
ncbi:lysostaphin resistance A-like protein [Listeria aquatica]|uniref:CPBP family intramembrane glutamic endopeptidase n=1 Tax=Listeria aquatica TaxID=1494960 RepID=UPI003F70A48D